MRELRDRELGVAMRVRISFAAFACAAVAFFALTGCALAQESPQKGQSPGRLEMAQQIRAGQRQPLEVQTLDALRHVREKSSMSPMLSTELFLRLDRNHDHVLARSEIPDDMSALRASFDKYDGNHDHRLTYSEFANYTDVIPNDLAGASH